MRIKTIALVFILILTMTVFSGCGSGEYNADALHVNYSADENYGSDDYLGSTLTIAGSGVDKEVQYTVKELEELAAGDENLQYQGEYSMMSRGGDFSVHEFTGIRLYELLVKSGLDENLPEDTDVRLVCVDGYALNMELGEVKESTECMFKAKTDTQPSEENVPKILAFGSDGVPLTGTVGSMKLGEDVPASKGYVKEADNVGGPIRLIFGQKSVGDFNAPENGKWMRQIIVGEDDNAKAHAEALGAEQALRSNDKVTVDTTKGQWNHSKEPYTQYLNTELKISGSEAKATTCTLKDLEEMADSTVTDSFGASCGVFGFQGVKLKDIVTANLAEGASEPSSIKVIGADGYETEIDVKDLINGIDSRYQSGEHRDIIIAYAVDGSPLVKNKKSEGFTGGNGFGPMRLVVENQTTRWVKYVTEVRIGD